MIICQLHFFYICKAFDTQYLFTFSDIPGRRTGGGDHICSICHHRHQCFPHTSRETHPEVDQTIYLASHENILLERYQLPFEIQ